MTSPTPQSGRDPSDPTEDTRDPVSRGHDGGPVGRMNTAGPGGKDDGTVNRTWWWLIIAVVVVLVVVLFWWLTGGGADNPEVVEEAPTQVTSTAPDGSAAE